MKVNILVDGKKFKELPISKQEEYRNIITDAQRSNVESRIPIMISEGKTEREIMEYLGLKHH